MSDAVIAELARCAASASVSSPARAVGDGVGWAPLRIGIGVKVALLGAGLAAGAIGATATGVNAQAGTTSTAAMQRLSEGHVV